MRVLNIYFQGGGVRYYRSTIPARALKRAGVEVLCPAPHEITDIDNFEQFLLKNARECDVIHVGYVTLAATIRLLLATRNYADIPLITDIDDDIYNVPTYNLGFKSYHGGAQERNLSRMQLRVSDLVSVSTTELLNILDGDCVDLVQLPNCLDPNDWQDPLPRSNREDVRILFAGNLGRYGDLNIVKDAIGKLMRQCSNVRLMFMGCVPDWSLEWMSDERDPLQNRCFHIRHCDIAYYQAILQQLQPDIIINPVKCNIFNKSKSHIKSFDAAMTGAALVCTDWPTHDEIPSDCAIKLDNTTTQWESALVELVKNQALRKRLAGRLRTWALDTQTIDKHVDKWVKLYERAVSKGPISDLSEIVRPGIGGGNGMARSRTTPAVTRSTERCSVASVRD